MEEDSISRRQYEQAQQDLQSFTNKSVQFDLRINNLQNQISELSSVETEEAIVEIERYQTEIENISQQKELAEFKIDQAQSVIDGFESQPFVPSESDDEVLELYGNQSNVVSPNTADVDTEFGDYDGAVARNMSQEVDEFGRDRRVPFGAMPNTPNPTAVNIRSINNRESNQDTRVRIRVPSSYYSAKLVQPIKNFGGIIFPYLPQIEIENKADYSAQAPMHSNFSQYFYQRSSVTPISISGKFTVGNEKEAEIYIATIHLLRALTKMRSGGISGDANTGAPPPICRLDAHGVFMLSNVPVSVTNFKVSLPDNVDYYTVGKANGQISNSYYGITSVPVISTISVTLNPMYSRNEMQKFNVTAWLNNESFRKAGYL